MLNKIRQVFGNRSSNVEESLELLRFFKSKSYEKLIATPHVMQEGYRNEIDDILRALEVVQEAAARENLDLKLEASAEYYLDENFQKKIKQKELLPLCGDYILFECSFLNRPANLHDTIFDLQMAGYKPVLAHPERYPYLFANNKLDHYRRIKEQGALLQLNLGSLIKAYPEPARTAARALVDAGLIDFVGSDLHRPYQLPLMDLVYQDKYLQKLCEQKQFLNPQLK
jgi:tyrosine-protein phosphatase YwqE